MSGLYTPPTFDSAEDYYKWLDSESERLGVRRNELGELIVNNEEEFIELLTKVGLTDIEKTVNGYRALYKED